MGLIKKQQQKNKECFFTFTIPTCRHKFDHGLGPTKAIHTQIKSIRFFSLSPSTELFFNRKGKNNINKKKKKSKIFTKGMRLTEEN